MSLSTVPNNKNCKNGGAYSEGALIGRRILSRIITINNIAFHVQSTNMRCNCTNKQENTRDVRRGEGRGKSDSNSFCICTRMFLMLLVVLVWCFYHDHRNLIGTGTPKPQGTFSSYFFTPGYGRVNIDLVRVV